jgi:Uma2 family endonuclease
MALTQLTDRYTVDDLYRLVGRGLLREDDRIELIHGRVVEMTPIGPDHAGAVKALHRLLRVAGDRVILGVQDPVVLAPREMPQPDVSLLKPTPGNYRHRHPGPADVYLLIEVSDTTPAYDRETKVPTYAAAGIPEVWLVNLPEARVEVFRGPRRGAYRRVSSVSRGATLAPLALPDISLSVDDILG